MIRVFKLSGEELAAMHGGKVQTVSSLRWHLRSLYGLPIFMQKFVQNDCLLADGSDLSVPSDVQLVLVANSAGRTEMMDVADALVRACSRGDFEIARALLSGCNVEDWRRLFTAGADTATEKNGVASLIFACDKGHVEVAQLLLEAGVNKNSAGILRDTPLMRASSKGHIEVVRLLVAAGVNMDFLSRISQHARHDGFASLDGLESLHLLMEFFWMRRLGTPGKATYFGDVNSPSEKAAALRLLRWALDW